MARQEAGVARQCAAKTRRGTRCRHRALPGGDFCRQHMLQDPGGFTSSDLGGLGRPPRSKSGPFADLFTAEERAALAALDGDGALDEVMQVLFVAIRRALSNGSPSNVVVRACEAYVRALKEQARLAGEAGAGLTPALNEALDQLGQELGIEL
jgi:hypothetical protein